MKKIIIILLIGLLIIPNNILAAGSVKPSVSNLNIETGKTVSFNITASNSAGQIVVSSSNISIATVDVGTTWVDNNTVKVNVKGIKEGTTTIKVVLHDVSTYDEEVLTNTYSINVTVKDKEVVNLSSNNNLESLTVEGYEVNKESDNIYTLNVSNEVDQINIIALAEDSKASVYGAGSKALVEGDMIFDIVIKAENGDRKTYTLKVNRESMPSLGDLITLLQTDETNINIKLGDSDVLSTEIIDSIKSSKKIVNLDYYNNENKIIYSWQLDGNKIDKTDSFNFKLNLSSTIPSEIDQAANYAKGIYLDFEHTGELPVGTKIKVYVGNHYINDEIINLYYFNEETNKLEIKETNLKVLNGYVETEIEHCSSYFLTKSNIGNVIESSNNDMVPISYLYNTILIAGILIIAGIIIYIAVAKIYPKYRKF